MEFEKKMIFSKHRPFEFEFKIKDFTISNAGTKRTAPFDSQLLTVRGIDVYLSAHGSGELPENKDFVVCRMKKRIIPDIDIELRVELFPWVCNTTCFFTILDVEGHKKFPRTLTLGNHSEDPTGECEERYIERSCILNNASEYLQEDTLTVIVEGNLKEGLEYGYYGIESWLPSCTLDQFETEQVKHNLNIYLSKYSKHFKNLLRHSRYFQNMMKHPMRERKQRILVRNEELPAFLCMLFFLDTENLLLYEATISDLYKIAHYYDIQVLLEECRKYIGTSLQRKIFWQPLYFAIRKFAKDYRDYKLKSTADYYIGRLSEQKEERNANLEIQNEFGDDIDWTTRPVSSTLIKTDRDFMRYAWNLWRKIKSYRTDQVLYVNELQMETGREALDFYQ